MLRMSSPFKTPEFKALFRQWNQILEKDGHQEIEDFTLPDVPLKIWEAIEWDKKTRATSRSAITIDANQQYYEIAERLLETFRFKSETHRLIWWLHCDGLSVRQISWELRFWLWDLPKSTVHDVVVKIERESGLKRG